MIDRGMKYEETITMITEECCTCGVLFGMTSDLNRRFRNNPNKWFYCPNSHHQHYTKSQKDIVKDELKNKIANQGATIAQLEDAIKKKDKAHRRLVKNGVCPCCNRSFVNLKRHVQNKHPEYLKD